MAELQRKLPAWRITLIDQILQDGNFHTLSELSKKLEWSARTLQRDLEYMKDSLYAPIESSNKGFRYTEPNFFIKSIPLSEGEAFSLAVLNPLLEQYRNTPLEEQLRAVFRKIIDCLPDRVTMDTSFLNEKVTFIPDKTESIEAKLFQKVFDSLKTCRLPKGKLVCNRLLPQQGRRAYFLAWPYEKRSHPKQKVSLPKGL